MAGSKYRLGRPRKAPEINRAGSLPVREGGGGSLASPGPLGRKRRAVVVPPGRQESETDSRLTTDAGSTPARSMILGKPRPYIGVRLSSASDCAFCEGLRIRDTWIHSARCHRTVVLWFVHDFKPSDWVSPFYQCCPFKCSGEVLSSAVIHSWDCAWWESEYNPRAVTPLHLEEPAPF